MNAAYIRYKFEREKNLKALGITAAVCGGLLLLFIFVSWTSVPVAPPVQDEGIEVNLGNSDQGLGDIAPQIPGELSAAEETHTNPPPQVTGAAAQPEEIKEVAENNETDVPTVHTSPKPVVKPKVNAIEKAPVKRKEQPVVQAPPAPPKPKAVYKGGTNTASGGNNADSYNGVKNQGIAGGTGDQGKPNGNPNSDSYTGNGGTGSSGIRVTGALRNRGYTLPRLQDDFNENAIVYVNIIVDATGKVLSSSIEPRGTTTTNATIRNIALTKAKQLKFAATKTEQESGTIIFTFKLQN